MSKRNFDDYLNESLNTLEKSIKPQKDLWTGVARAIVNINQPTQQRYIKMWPKLAAIAASTVAVIIALNMFVIIPKQQPIIVMSDYFTQQKHSLLVQYENQYAFTDDWQMQLQQLENAEQAIIQALKNEPKNQALLSMLTQIHNQQLDLINKVHAPRWQHI